MAKMALIKKRKKTQRVSKLTQQFTDRKAMGDVPVVSEYSSNVEMIRVFNWYNYMTNRKEAPIFLMEYLEANDKKAAKHIARLDESKIERTICYIADILNRKQNVPPVVKKKLDDHIKALMKIKIERTVQNEETNSDPFKEDRGDFVIADIEDMIDAKNFDASLYDYLNGNSIPKIYCGKIADHYVRLQEELEAAVNKTDKEIVEAYSAYSRKELKDMFKFINSVMDDLERYAENKKKERKPRAKKAKSADDILKFMEPCKEDKELRIVSIDKNRILISSELWVYNIKYGTLVHFVAEDGKNLGVHRSSIINYDKDKSTAKKVGRKAAEAIALVLNPSKKERKKAFDLVNTNTLDIPDRINNNVVLLNSAK